jgi:hypothetical protein
MELKAGHGAVSFLLQQPTGVEIPPGISAGQVGTIGLRDSRHSAFGRGWISAEATFYARDERDSYQAVRQGPAAG